MIHCCGVYICGVNCQGCIVAESIFADYIVEVSIFAESIFFGVPCCGSIVTESIVPVYFCFVVESNVVISIVAWSIRQCVLLRCLLLRGP